MGVQVLATDGREVEKKQALIEGLKKVNEGLPANVYIPFVNHSWRNYTVLNICVDESKLFLTKNRAPYMICLEIFRPEEILITSQNKYQSMMMLVNQVTIKKVISTAQTENVPLTE